MRQHDSTGLPWAGAHALGGGLAAAGRRHEPSDLAKAEGRQVLIDMRIPMRIRG